MTHPPTPTPTLTNSPTRNLMVGPNGLKTKWSRGVAEHGITAEDTIVGGYPGTIARCVCGWSSSWSIQDGSAEADGHAHVMRSDPEARARSEEHSRAFLAKHAAWLVESRKRTAERAAEAKPKQSEHSHNCSCHLGAPCSACVNCKHPAGDVDGCPNDCQECEIGHDY